MFVVTNYNFPLFPNGLWYVYYNFIIYSQEKFTQKFIVLTTMYP